MSKATKRVKVGDNWFRLRRYAPFTGLELFGDVQHKLLAPALSVFNGVEAGSDGAFAAQAAGGLEKVMRGLPGKEMRALAEKILQPDYVIMELGEGEDGVKLDEHVATRYGLTPGDLIELCVEMLVHNYSDFWQRVSARFGPVLQKVMNRPDDSAEISYQNS